MQNVVPLCPSCEGSSYKKDGIANGHQHYRCSLCSHRWRILLADAYASPSGTLERLVCPRCQGQHTQRKGFRRGHQVGFCHDCQRRWIDGTFHVGASSLHRHVHCPRCKTSAAVVYQKWIKKRRFLCLACQHRWTPDFLRKEWNTRHSPLFNRPACPGCHKHNGARKDGVDPVSGKQRFDCRHCGRGWIEGSQSRRASVSGTGPRCCFCESPMVIKKGIRRGKQQLHCRYCLKWWCVPFFPQGMPSRDEVG